MRKMKDSGVEWIGEIPADWQTHRIKVNFQIITGNGFPPQFQGMVGEQYPMCKASDISYADKCLCTAANSVSEEVVKEQRFNIIPSGSILFAKIGEAMKKNNRAINVIPCCIDNNCQAMVPHKINKDFGYYIFSVIDLNEFDNGGTVPCINNQKLRDYFIPYPSVDEQQHVADYLDCKCSQIDTIIARQQEVIEKLKAYKLSIITEAVTKGLNPDVPMKDSGVEWIGEIPEHWTMLKLKYASSILRGKFNHRPRNDPAYYDGNHPFVQTGDVARANKYIKNYSQTLNEKGYAVSKEFPANSICMTIAANVGDVAILTFDACFPDSVVGFVPSDNIAWNYLYYVLTAMKKQFVRNAIISTQLNLNIEIIKEEFIPVAPIHIQEQISRFLDDKCFAIDRTISAKQCVIDKLTDYKKSLIYEVVTGKKEV